LELSEDFDLGDTFHPLPEFSKMEDVDEMPPEMELIRKETPSDPQPTPPQAEPSVQSESTSPESRNIASSVSSKDTEEKEMEVSPIKEVFNCEPDHKLRESVKPKGHSLTEQLMRGIFKRDFRIDPTKSLDPSHKRRGRPENAVDMSPANLKRLIAGVRKGLVEKVKNNQRSDARTASICRHLAKIPDHFLKALGSKCRFKSNLVPEVLSSYIKAYIGFIDFYEVTEEKVGRDYLIKMFFDFICLKFPDNKVKAMLSFFVEEGLLSESDVSLYSAFLELRKSASKKSFQYVFKENKAFQLLIKNTQKFLKGDGSAPEVISKVLESLEKED
jgi:hypothetical protein